MCGVPDIVNSRTSAGCRSALPAESSTSNDSFELYHSYSLSAWMTFGQVRD